MNDRGEFVGSVSGGCIEGAVVTEALAAIKDGNPRTLEFGPEYRVAPVPDFYAEVKALLGEAAVL